MLEFCVVYYPIDIIEQREYNEKEKEFFSFQLPSKIR
jgi:hypothetical protein